MSANEQPEWTPGGFEQSLNRATRLGKKPKIKWCRPNRFMEWLAAFVGYQSPFERRMCNLLQAKAASAERVTLRFDYIHIWHTVRINGEIYSSVGYSQNIEGMVWRHPRDMGTVLHASDIGQITGGN